jgi:7-carboxy-7-deazaguanine synthase
MKVNEIFYSIQGESSFAGLPCAFIRLAYCNLRCSYCDTEYAFYESQEMSIPEIMRAIESFPTRLALVTGGEPMLQKPVHELFQSLLARDYTVLLETGGHMPLADVDPRVHKVMDFKCPSSGMQSHNNYGNVESLSRNDEVKFVIGDHNDFDWACEVVRRYDLFSRVGSVLFSPVHKKLSYQELANWVLTSGLPVRLQIQLHKIIWPGALRGV